MGKRTSPRHGSMQFWHRKRAAREYARVRNYPTMDTKKVLGFAGYKAGMTQIVAVDNRKTSLMKGSEVVMPVTIVECPPLKIAAVRFYISSYRGLSVGKEVYLKTDKELTRRTGVGKEVGFDAIKAEDYVKATILVYTQPKLTGIGKKKPELFEIAFGGSVSDAIAYAQSTKEIKVSDVFAVGQLVDVHSVTKGKGYQGPVKRFGIAIRHHKSEKTKRGPGSLGAWHGHAHFMYRVPHAGQMGYHTRCEHNKQIVAFGNGDIKIAGGIPNYGELKNDYILVKGSVGGPKKRLIRFNFPIRKSSADTTPYTIEVVQQHSHQGV